MGADRTWVDLWAKDYGGQATIKVELLRDLGAPFPAGSSFVVFDWTLEVPLDRDFDDFADMWERTMLVDWNNQYGAQEGLDPNHALGVDTNFFDDFPEAYFDERRDPDGPLNSDGGINMPEHLTVGDSLTVLQEYRGFILDGGHHPFAEGIRGSVQSTKSCFLKSM